MKSVKNLFFASLFVTFTAFAAFDEVTLEKYPDADCVIVDTLMETVYQPDGAYISTDEMWIKVLTDKGRREESELQLRYNLRYSVKTIDFVSVIGEDGVERPIDVAATTKESVDNASAKENIYDPMNRRVVCTIPGIKVGETLHYRTRETARRSRVENQYADITILEWPCPVVRQVVRVKAPAERPLFHAVRKPLGNVKYDQATQDDGSVLHTWTAENTPQAFPEPDMPPLYGQLQHLLVSTAESWPQLSRWYWNLCLPHLEKTNDAIVAKVNELVAGLPAGESEEAVLSRIAAVYKWVAQEIRYMGLTMEDTSPGYAPHDVSVTFANRYGVCRDKAGLLVAMLRLAGLEAFPVLIHSESKMDDEIPLPYFNHAIVAVYAPNTRAANRDGFILMDPTDESSRDLLPAYLSDCSYLVARPQGEELHTSPVPAADRNLLRVTSEGRLEKDGTILLSAQVDFLGLNDNVYRGTLLRCTPVERRQLFERIVRNVAAGAELLSFELTPTDLQDTTTPLQTSLMVRVPETLLRGETRDEFTPPMLSRQLGAANWMLNGSLSLAKRRFPLAVQTTASVEETMKIRLDGNVGAPLSLPEDVAITGPYEFVRRYAVENGVFVAHRRLAINSVEFSPEDYDRVREQVKQVEACGRQHPVFAHDEFTDANVRNHLVRSAFGFISPTAWTVTNTVEQAVLTYDGKKSSSELTFSYNPTWQKVELVEAVVKNADGTVATVTDHEMNVFDCNWASAAPRYPASKELIVNLPSVEVGSVITYTTVTTVTNAPAAFYGIFYNDVLEPTDALVTTIDGETSVVRNPKRLKAEPMQPEGRVWRQPRIVAKGDFKATAARLLPATEVAALKKEGLDDLRAIRDWMARHIRVAGPSLYEVPLAQQLTDPETVLKERYATRLDYVRTMTALLKGAGYDADIVFASQDATRDPRVAQADMFTQPNERAFGSALCRVRVKEGGFWGFGGTEKIYFLGTENEYTPIGATPFLQSHYFDPQTASFGLVTVPEAQLAPRGERTYRINVRENGMADISVEELTWGPGVGGFRKSYAEMLPEDRKRHYEELLGSLSQAAEATQDLMTDLEAYPARRTFACVVPNYATVEGDAITLSLPEIGTQLFSLTGSVRETPIGLTAADPFELKLEVTFPAGYVAWEHLPEDLSVAVLPADYQMDYVFEGSLDETGTHLTLRASKKQAARTASLADKRNFEHLKAMNRQATSRAMRTVTVRKAEK